MINNYLVTWKAMGSPTAMDNGEKHTPHDITVLNADNAQSIIRKISEDIREKYKEYFTTSHTVLIIAIYKLN